MNEEELYEKLKNLEKIKNLEIQIEKMKCCENCLHWKESFQNFCACAVCNGLNNWKMRG